jgi:hypothetical protein
LPTVCLGWLWIVILLIFASWVAGIIGMNHQHLASLVFIVPLPYILYFIWNSIAKFCSPLVVVFEAQSQGIRLVIFLLQYFCPLAVWAKCP